MLLRPPEPSSPRTYSGAILRRVLRPVASRKGSSQWSRSVSISRGRVMVVPDCMLERWGAHTDLKCQGSANGIRRDPIDRCPLPSHRDRLLKGRFGRHKAQPHLLGDDEPLHHHSLFLNNGDDECVTLLSTLWCRFAIWKRLVEWHPLDFNLAAAQRFPRDDSLNIGAEGDPDLAGFHLALGDRSALLGERDHHLLNAPRFVRHLTVPCAGAKTGPGRHGSMRPQTDLAAPGFVGRSQTRCRAQSGTLPDRMAVCGH